MLVPQRPLARSLVLGACLLTWWIPTKAERPPACEESLSGERSSADAQARHAVERDPLHRERGCGLDLLARDRSDQRAHTSALTTFY
jgi:hypothetical protein